MPKILIILLFFLIFFIFLKNYHIKKSYEEIYIHMPKDELIDIIGKPNEIIYDGIDNKVEEWRYYRFLLPSSYSIILKNEIVIDKKVLISP